MDKSLICTIQSKIANFIHDFYYANLSINDCWTYSYYRGSATFVRLGPFLIQSHYQYEYGIPHIDIIVPADAIIVSHFGDPTYNYSRAYTFGDPKNARVEPLGDCKDDDIWNFISVEIDKKIETLNKLVQARKDKEEQNKIVFENERQRLKNEALESARKFISK